MFASLREGNLRNILTVLEMQTIQNLGCPDNSSVHYFRESGNNEDPYMVRYSNAKTTVLGYLQSAAKLLQKKIESALHANWDKCE